MGIYKVGMKVHILAGELKGQIAKVVDVRTEGVGLRISSWGETLAYLYHEIEPRIMVDLAPATSDTTPAPAADAGDSGYSEGYRAGVVDGYTGSFDVSALMGELETARAALEAASTMFRAVMNNAEYAMRPNNEQMIHLPDKQVLREIFMMAVRADSAVMNALTATDAARVEPGAGSEGVS